MTERPNAAEPEQALSDEEIRDLQRNDPAVRARVEQIRGRIDRGDPSGPLVTEEELPGFLREHG